jgi:hypothetical protein
MDDSARAPTASSATGSGGAIVAGYARFKGARRSWGWPKIVATGVFLLVLAGVIAGGIFFMLSYQKGLKDGPDGAFQVFHVGLRNLRHVDEKVLKLTVPKNVWELNPTIRTGLKALVAVERAEPDAWLAIAAKDYGMRKPRDAELIKEAMERLQEYFGETLELGAKVEGGELPGLAGQPAQRLEFRGQIKAVVWRGECHMLTRQGIGYWLFIASSSLEDAQHAFADLQKERLGFTPFTERKGWSEQPPPMDNFTGDKGLLTVKAPEGVWEKFSAKDEDENGELFLRGLYLKEKDNRKNALVLIATMNPKADLKEAAKTARDYVEEVEKRVVKDYLLVPVDEDKEGGLGYLTDIGNKRGRLLEMKLQLKDEPKRYVLLGVINDADSAFFLRCECTWESRQIWRQEFLDLLAKLRIRKGA